MQYGFVCVYTHNQLLEFVWCGTRGDIFATHGDLVVVCKVSLVLALVQTRILSLDWDSDQAEQNVHQIPRSGAHFSSKLVRNSNAIFLVII